MKSLGLIKPDKHIGDYFDQNKDEPVSEGDMLAQQEALHKIQLVQLNALKQLQNNQNKLLEEYMYINPKVQDYFYL
jgi:hypothetical protein